MGQEIPCTVQFAGKRIQGTALLESKEILFRGDPRLKIPFTSIKEIKAADGELHVMTAGGLAIFELGAKAETWRDKILKPKSLVEKLGVKPGEFVALHGRFDQNFLSALKKHGVKISKAPNSPWTLLLAQKLEDLAKVRSLSKALQGAAALWVVYPKGQKTITENEVRGAGLRAGLTDVKVASFSDKHTALKFVIPRAKR
jgi:hypothetical protein